MTQAVVIDTDVLIDFGLDKEDSVTTMSILEENYQLSISVITAMELYAGCRSKRDLKKVEILIADLHLIYVSKSNSARAFQLMKKFRSSHGVEINDMLIASTAIEIGAKIISKNQKHYHFLPDIDLLEYPLDDI